MTPGANDAGRLALPASPRIAVFRALQLGDMLCAVPALRALRRRYPDAHVTLIGLPWAASFIERYATLIDDLLWFPGGPGFPEQPLPALEAVRAFHAGVRGRRFDLALQLHGSGERLNAMMLHFGAAHLAGFHPTGRPAPNLPRDRSCFIPWPEHAQEAERYCMLMRALGMDCDARDSAFPLQQADHDEWRAVAAHHALLEERLVCIHPGARLRSRRWPVARYAAVANALADEGWQIVVTGAHDEAHLAAELARHSRAPVVDLTGVTSIGGLAALLSHARLLICNDTGVSHVAAAVKARSVVIASGSDVRRWAPADRDLHRVLAHHPPCRPCMHENCPTGHECARGVTVDSVLEAARAQLAARGSVQSRDRAGFDARAARMRGTVHPGEPSHAG